MFHDALVPFAERRIIRMKEKTSLFLVCLLLLISFTTALYPIVSNLQKERIQRQQILDYQNAVEQVPEKKLNREWKRAKTYNWNLVQNGVVVADPFDPRKYVPDQKTYTDLLNPNGDGIMDYLEISKISLKLPIRHGTEAETLANAVGHLEGTSLPTGGKVTHAVLSAHRGLPSTELFTNLDRLAEGDIFTLYILDKILYYKVDSIKVVEPEEVDDLRIIEGKDSVTLVTCTPYSINSHRLLVRGQRRAAVDGQNGEKENFFSLHVYECVAVPVLLVICVAVAGAMKRNIASRREKEEAKEEK